jgi:hypothetical protein
MWEGETSMSNRSPVLRGAIALALLVASLLMLRVAPATAQTATGSITGIVTDTSGALVPDGAVTLTNIDTAELRQTSTNSAGVYQFASLIPGRYRLAIVKDGFNRVTQEPIAIEVEKVMRLDFALQIGSVTEAVEVSSQAELLQAETSSLSQAVDSRKANELPLNGRNPLALATLVPGVVPQGSTQSAPTTLNLWAYGNYQLGGGMANTGSSYLDGAPMNIGYGHITSFIPTQDSLQEFRVLTNNMSAEYGRLSGGVMNFSTKSGTNGLHFTAYEFLRNKALNSNNFFNNATGISTPPFTQNQFGFTIGGPTDIPHVYRGRDKTFFFFSLEDFQLRQGYPYLSTVPSLAVRNGDFSNDRSASGAQIPIYDPTSTRPNPAVAGDYIRTPFTGNIIPPSRMNTAAVNLLPYLLPLPNTPGTLYTNTNNWSGNANAGGQNAETVVRIDHNLSVNQRLMGRYTYWADTNLPQHPFGNAVCADHCNEHLENNNVAIDYVNSITPSTVLDVRASYLLFLFQRHPIIENFDTTAILGWPQAQSAARQFYTVPFTSQTGYGFNTTAGTTSRIIAASEEARVAGDVTKIIRSHTIKIGAELTRMRQDSTLNNSGGGSFSDTSAFTASNPLKPTGGDAMATFLLGYLSGGSISINYIPAGQMMYPAFYATDDWKITRKLTMNIGLRWEEDLPFTERHDRLSYFQPDVVNPVTQPAGLPFKGALGLVASSSRDLRYWQNPNHKQFSPRFGIAYRVGPNTVVRSGYGIFWLPNEIVQNTFPSYDLTNSDSTAVNTSIDGGLTPFATLNNPFPQGILQPPGRNLALLNSQYLGQSIPTYANGIKFGYSQQWNFDVQQQFHGLLLDVAYAGAKGTHLPFGSGQLDILPDDALALGSKLLTQVPNPLFGIVNIGSLSAATVPYEQLLRPYPQYNGLSITAYNNADSTYESLQFKMEKRFSNNASILLSYTHAKNISDTDSLAAWLESAGASNVQDWNNLRAEKALSAFDVPNRLVTSYVLDLPFGKGRRYLSSASPVVNGLVGGWGLQGIVTYSAGFPLHITNATNNSNALNGGQRPNVVGDPSTVTATTLTGRLNQWFNTAAFAQPAPFTFGNEPRNDPRLRGDHLINSDVSLVKTLQIHESLALQFRAECFNMVNHPQFAAPNTSFGTAQFGQVSAQQNLPRLVQLSLRLRF